MLNNETIRVLKELSDEMNDYLKLSRYLNPNAEFNAGEACACDFMWDCIRRLIQDGTLVD